MKSLVVSFLIFTSILTIAFLWKELQYINFNKKINHDKVGNYFAALGTVAAAISLFLVYQQIKEMQNDRTAKTQPDLQPLNSEFELHERPRENGGNFTSPFILDIYNVIKNKTVTNEQAFVELENIGTGPAKDLEVIWKYETPRDVGWALEKVYQYISQKQFHTVQEFSYVKINEKIKIIAPYQFLATFSQRLSQFSSSITTPTISYLELRLILIYRDMHHNRTVKEYYVKLDMLDSKRIRCRFETLSVG